MSQLAHRIDARPVGLALGVAAAAFGVGLVVGIAPIHVPFMIAAALIMGVRSILVFSRQAAEMAPKILKLDANLSRIRDSMESRKKSVKDLTVIVDPLRIQEGRIRDYFEKIKNMELDHERESADQEEKDEAEKRKRIQRKKMGFD